MKHNSTNYGIYRPISWLVLIIALVFISGVGYSQVAINNDNSAPDASAMLDVKATGLGLLAPRMTFAQRPGAPATGLLIYQTDSDPGYYYYDGATWQKIGRIADHYWGQNGADIFNTNSGNVYLGAAADSDGNRLNVQNYNTAKAAVRGTEQSGAFIFSEGQLGVLNWPTNPLALPIDVANIGVLGIKPANGVQGTGVFGWNTDVNLVNYAGIFVSEGAATGTNYGVYGAASGATTNWAGYFDGRVYTSGAVGIGTENPIGSLHIDGSTEVIHLEATTSPLVTFYDDAGTYKAWFQAFGNDFYVANNLNGYLRFRTNNADRMRIDPTGNVQIGSIAATGYRLAVDGKVICEEIRVEDSGSWPDYVFDNNYDLMSLEELEESIAENNHLPGLPSAAEVEENGFLVADMQKRVLEKVEELTLYTIEQGKLIEQLQEEIKSLKSE